MNKCSMTVSAVSAGQPKIFTLQMDLLDGMSEAYHVLLK